MPESKILVNRYSRVPYGSDGFNRFPQLELEPLSYLPLDKVVGSLALSGIYPFVHSQLGMVGVTISEYPSLEYWDPYFTASITPSSAIAPCAPR